MCGLNKLVNNVAGGIGDILNNPLKAVKDGLNDRATLTGLAALGGGAYLMSQGGLGSFGSMFGSQEASVIAASDATAAADVTAMTYGEGAALGGAPAATTTAAEAATAAPAAAGKAASSTLLSKAGNAAATAVGTSVATNLLAPKPQTPKVAPTTAMPDPVATQEAQRRKRIEQLARRGRASTIMTDSGG